MKIICPNVNLPEWRDLVSKVGKERAYLAWFRHGGDEIPTPEQAQAHLSENAKAPVSPEKGGTSDATGKVEQPSGDQPQLSRNPSGSGVPQVEAGVREDQGGRDGGGGGDERVAQPADPEVKLDPEREKYLKDAANAPGAKFQYTVFRLGGDIPDAIQVDAIGKDGQGLGSGTPAEFRAVGADVPDVPKSVPQGQYSIDELRALASDGGDKPVPEPQEKLPPEPAEQPKPAETAGAAKAAEGEPSVQKPGTPEAKTEPGKPEPGIIDRAISGLESLKIHQPGRTFAATPFSLAWDASLNVAITGLKAGKAVGRVLAEASSHFRSKFPGATPQQVQRLEAAIRRHAATPGATTPSPSAMTNARSKIADFVGAGKMREAMAYTRDVADNKAGIHGRQQANSVDSMVRKSFASSKERKMARQALAFAVESGADANELAAMRDKIENSTNPVKKATNALEAIAFARANLSKFAPIVSKYNEIMDAQLGAEQSAGFDTAKHRNYVMHAQEVEGDNPILGLFSEQGGRGDTSTSFRKVRDFATLADSIAAGVNPKNIDAVDLLQSRVTRGQQMLNRKSWVEGMKQMTDPATKQPIIMDAPKRARSDGTLVPEAPKGYSLEHNGFESVAVKHGYEGTFSALTDPSWWGKSAIRRGFMKANAAGKTLSLAIDTYHLGRLAAWNAVTRLNALGLLGGGTAAPKFWSHEKGINLLDKTAADIISDGRQAGLHPAEIRQQLAQKAKLNLLVENGANFGRVEDALYQEFVRNVPGIGKLNKFIFDQFQRGAMAEVGLMEYDRQRGMSGNAKLSNAEVARKVAKDVNTRFGNLGRQGLFRSRTAQDISKMLVLAAQWNEGLVRSEMGSIKQAAQTAGQVVTGKGFQTGLLARSVATFVVGQFLANQVINMATRGHPTWDNPEEGMGAKLSAWIPDVIGKGPGFFLHPASIGAEVIHLLTTAYERTGNWDQAVDRFVRGRLSTIARPAWTYATATDSFGRPTGQHRLKETARAADPLPFIARPVDPFQKQVMVGQAQKQVMQSFGVKTDQAPSFEQRIKSLAHDFNVKHGTAPDVQFAVSDYADVDSALKVGDQKAALEAMVKLMETKSPQQIKAAYARRKTAPFTGRVGSESSFKLTLNPEERVAYRKALQERSQLAEQAMRLVSQAEIRKRQQAAAAR